MSNTCCSLSCPFINICKHYNFLVDRGNKCEIMESSIERAIKTQKNRKKSKTESRKY